MLAPFEVTVIGNEAWTRRPDGSWWSIPSSGDDAAGGAVVAGPLAPFVLDAGSVLELLRLPKESLRDLGLGGEVAGEAVRHLRFTVRPTPSLRYQVDAWVGAQGQLLRQLAMTSTGTWTDPRGSAVRWRSSSTVRLFGFGERVVITKPDAALVRASPRTTNASSEASVPNRDPASVTGPSQQSSVITDAVPTRGSMTERSDHARF